MILMTQKASVTSGTLFSIRARRQLQGSPKICPSEHRGRADAIQGIRHSGHTTGRESEIEPAQVGRRWIKCWEFPTRELANTEGWTAIRWPVRILRFMPR